jgi:hypothetical protein
MRHFPAIAVVPILLVSSLPVHAQQITLSPEQVGEIFCISSLGNDMAAAEALLSYELAEIVAVARAQSEAFEAANPGEKPPLGDGLPWRSWPDYADGCTVSDMLMERESADVEISYSFSATPDANYTNTLRLRPASFADGAEPIWRIDDIDLGDTTMRSLLESPQ